MAEKPERFFDARGRQEYLTAREAELRADRGRRAPLGEVAGVFARLLAVELATILGLMVLIAVLARLEDGDAGWQSAFLGPTLLLLVPLAGTVWTLISVGKHEFSGPPGPMAMRVCVALMVAAFTVFILAGVWVLSLLDPGTYDASTVSQLSWAAIAVPTTIIGICLLLLWTWRLPLWLNLTLALALIAVVVFVGLLPVFQIIGATWPDPLLTGLRVAGPALLVIAVALLPTERALLLADNDVVGEAIDRATGTFDQDGPSAS
ncbi:hypothetical protein [Aeromicrobium piscarium]|uniref:Uncharacterized protein n=1 Tax=Aeromicrobium piscarium TaxID=2590901 RepID=A0A554SDF1_9ACTN|nr:hypothetical protein [Aeromicrobium piscarium]TSD64380.1 hypothetical protein FNM00_07535 [Aeromicrobium piscarium]